MATQQREGHARIGNDGVTVQKSVSEISNGVYQVWFEFGSTVEEPIAFRMVEALPTAVDPADVGFHPDHGGDQWSATQDELRYAETLPPHGEACTVYAVRDITEAIADDLRGSPSVEIVELAGSGHGLTGAD